MIVHVASPYAPVRREVDLEESCHPVLLVLLCGQVLKFQTCRECRGPLVEEVSHHDVRKPCGLEVSVCRIILLHRVHEHHLELLCPLLLDVEAEVTEQQVARLCSSFLGKCIICREIGVNLHSPLSSDGRTAAEIIECVKLSSNLTAVECVCRLVSHLRIVRMEGCQHVSILGAHCRHIGNEVRCRKRP